MNTNHYPSLELCKKLTEIGFPETEHTYAFCRWTEKDASLVRKEEAQEWKCYTEVGKCPSVMEMLDVMPYKIEKWEISYYLTLFGKKVVQYQPDNFHAFTQPLLDIRKNPPDALAEMILWLHENKHITFPTP